MEPVEGQWRREEDVAQQHGDAHQDGTPVVELVGGDVEIEEIHPYHRQTSQIDDVENQLGPCVAQPELKDAIEHHAHGEHSCYGRDADVEYLSIFLESCLHKPIVLDDAAQRQAIVLLQR